MIITEIYDGQGLGNQLWCYVATRVIALDKGVGFGIKSPEKFKCNDFLSLDLGEPVVGGNGPEGGPPRTLPEGIRYYYNERRITHPENGVDIRTYDPNLVAVPDGTKIDGVMQDERYIAHRKEEIREWLKVKEEYECFDYASDDICVINFRGGEYVHAKELFLSQKYWDDAIARMRKINPNFTFVVITDDVATAKKFFPSFSVNHFSISKDYVVLKNAHYLILSNSSFACFPAWLNKDLKQCIAPKYWARHNDSDGFWACSYNIIKGWLYLDREGNLQDAETCSKELEAYMKAHPDYYELPKVTENFIVVSNYYNDLSWVPEYGDNYLVYDQSDAAIYPPKLDPKKVIKSEHLGHNIRDYCTFIIDHYDNLPERTVFVPGNVFPRHVSRDRFDRLVNAEYFTPIEDLRTKEEQWPVAFFSSDGGYMEINDSWYLRIFPTKYFHDYNDFLRFCFVDPVIPRYVRLATGANYVVPKGNIRKLPKAFYENLRLFVSHCETAIPGESHIIERAFHTLWTANFKVSPAMMKPLPKDFAGVPATPPTLADRVAGTVKNKAWQGVRAARTVRKSINRRLSR